MLEAPASLRYRRYWLGFGWAILLIIFYMALRPLPGAAIVGIWSDKVWHALAFGALMLWFSGVYPPRQFGRLFLLLLSYGILIEVVQAFTPHRQVELADVLANISGAAAGWLLAIAGLRHWCRWLESSVIRR